MLLSIFKVISLAFLLAGTIVPVMAGDDPVPAGSGGSSQPAKLTPQTARQKWVEKYHEQPGIGLSQKFQSSPKGKPIYGIELMRNFGVKQATSNPAFNDFVPSINNINPGADQVSVVYAASHFLLESLPLFQEDKGKNAAVRGNVVNAMESFLTFSGKAKESKEGSGSELKFRDATAKERGIILAGFIEVASSRYNENKLAGDYDYNYWKKYLEGKHGTLKDNETFKKTLNTEAVAAALAVAAIRGAVSAAAINKILTDSTADNGMADNGMFVNFIKEINTATKGKLGNILTALAPGGSSTSVVSVSPLPPSSSLPLPPPTSLPPPLASPLTTPTVNPTVTGPTAPSTPARGSTTGDGRSSSAGLPPPSLPPSPPAVLPSQLLQGSASSVGSAGRGGRGDGGGFSSSSSSNKLGGGAPGAPGPLTVTGRGKGGGGPAVVAPPPQPQPVQQDTPKQQKKGKYNIFGYSFG